MNPGVIATSIQEILRRDPSRPEEQLLWSKAWPELDVLSLAKCLVARYLQRLLVAERNQSGIVATYL